MVGGARIRAPGLRGDPGARLRHGFGILLLSSILVTLINILVDVLYAWLDPRVQLASAGARA